MTKISERGVLYAAIFVLALVIIISRSPIARAITPTGPGLKDGSGVYLGQLLSTHYDVDGQRITYTTYLPSVDGVLQFATDQNQGGPFMNWPSDILFDESGCQGTGYVDATGIWVNPWVVIRFDSEETFKVASSTQHGVAFQSVLQQTNCIEESGELLNAHKLKPVTLPFNPNNVVLPFKITAM